MLEVKIGERRADQSFAAIEVAAPTSGARSDLILRLRQEGAEVEEKGDAQLAVAPADGIFPADFFVTTNQQTFVRIGGEEYEVRPAMMDSGIAFDRAKKQARTARFADLRKGMEVVVGHQGVRIVPVQRVAERTDVFQLRNAMPSGERPRRAV